ncbi:MAG: hypothetical protein AAF517_17150 [Planctomycetota bacterium]
MHLVILLTALLGNAPSLQSTHNERPMQLTSLRTGETPFALQVDGCDQIDCEVEMSSMTCADLCDLIEDIEEQIERVDNTLEALQALLDGVQDALDQVQADLFACLNDPTTDDATCIDTADQTLSEIFLFEALILDRIAGWQDVKALLEADLARYNQIKKCCCP